MYILKLSVHLYIYLKLICIWLNMYISVGDDKRVDVYVNMMVVSLYDLSEVGMVSLIEARVQ